MWDHGYSVVGFIRSPRYDAILVQSALSPAPSIAAHHYPRMKSVRLLVGWPRFDSARPSYGPKDQRIIRRLAAIRFALGFSINPKPITYSLIDLVNVPFWTQKMLCFSQPCGRPERDFLA